VYPLWIYGLLIIAYFRFFVLLSHLLPFQTLRRFTSDPNWLFLDAGILFSLAITFIFLRWWNARRSHFSESHGIDDALDNPSDDRLERAKFSERVFKLIDGTPVDSNVRIGIYGEWGGGKTTVLNFIKWHCQQAGHPVVTFSPWQFHDRKEAWKGFVSSVDKGLSKWRKVPFGRLQRWRFIKAISNYAIDIADNFDVPLAKQIAKLALAPLEGLLEETKARVQAYLNRVLGEKRLYIFIDDLDRATPEVAYELLMLLNEIVDLNRCIYVVGLDREETANLIEKKIQSGKGKDFLEKIINWPFELPVPVDLEWKQLLQDELQRCSDINANAMNSIFEFLPRNARKFKHFIRYVGSLHRGFLTRFSKDELEWPFLYLAQLFRFEFPEEFRQVIKNEELVKNIPAGYLDYIHKEKNRGKTAAQQERPEWELEFEKIIEKLSAEQKERIKKLYGAMRQAASLIDDAAVRTHLLVVEVPELFTWKEFHEFMTQLRGANPDDTKARLKELIGKGVGERLVESVREFIKMLIRHRNRLLSEVADVLTEPEQRTLLEQVDEIMRVCDLLLDLDELFQGNAPIFDGQTFKEWYSHLQHWAHFTEPASVYSKTREAEKNLILKLARRVAYYPTEALDVVRPMFRGRGYTSTEVEVAFRPTHLEARKILNQALAEQIIERFERADGIKSIWGKTLFLAEKELLFSESSEFHTNEIYEKLDGIAQKAKHDIAIQKNFVEFIRMLFYSATEGTDWAMPEESQKILKIERFRKIVWGAVTAKPLNGRTIGDTEGKRKIIIQKFFEGNEDILPVPAWWQETIRAFEKKKATEQAPVPATP